MTRSSPAQIRDHIRATRGNTRSLFFSDFWSVLASDLPKSAKLTRLALLGFADATGEKLGTAYPGIDTLAALTSQSRRGVLYDSALLETRGWLAKKPRSGHLTTERALRIPAQTIAELDDLLAADVQPVAPLDVQPAAPLDVQPAAPNRLRGSAQSIGPEKKVGSEPAAILPLKSAVAVLGENDSRAGIERARRIATDLRALDGNHVLSGRLFTDAAYAELAAIVEQFGEVRVRTAVHGFLAGDRAGHPKRRGHVQHWRYFRIVIEREELQCIPVE